MGTILSYVHTLSAPMLLALTVLPYIIGIAWAMLRRSALLLLVALIIQRVEFILIFASIMGDVSSRITAGGGFIPMIFVLVIGNTGMLLGALLVSAGLRKPGKY